ncbi:hypothetical protein D9757_011756 [Collybiopsis confluens]|uniref:Uncharacterized protein n=1 Tax=Collybiopsis confluens TaxID=2823264 RepID=A0A8H5GI57_9AGAR|nr:hypothetical protein D9757_011756 [Collybiopsis confluens]
MFLPESSKFNHERITICPVVEPCQINFRILELRFGYSRGQKMVLIDGLRKLSLSPSLSPSLLIPHSNLSAMHLPPTPTQKYPDTITMTIRKDLVEEIVRLQGEEIGRLRAQLTKGLVNEPVDLGTTPPLLPRACGASDSEEQELSSPITEPNESESGGNESEEVVEIPKMRSEKGTQCDCADVMAAERKLRHELADTLSHVKKVEENRDALDRSNDILRKTVAQLSEEVCRAHLELEHTRALLERPETKTISQLSEEVCRVHSELEHTRALLQKRPETKTIAQLSEEVCRVRSELEHTRALLEESKAQINVSSPSTLVSATQDKPVSVEQLSKIKDLTVTLEPSIPKKELQSDTSDTQSATDDPKPGVEQQQLPEAPPGPSPSFPWQHFALAHVLYSPVTSQVKPKELKKLCKTAIGASSFRKFWSVVSTPVIVDHRNDRHAWVVFVSSRTGQSSSKAQKKVEIKAQKKLPEGRLKGAFVIRQGMELHIIGEYERDPDALPETLGLSEYELLPYPVKEYIFKAVRNVKGNLIHTTDELMASIVSPSGVVIRIVRMVQVQPGKVLEDLIMNEARNQGYEMTRSE